MRTLSLSVALVLASCGADSTGAASPTSAPSDPEDWGDRLQDPRFQDISDHGPEVWPEWTPNHVLERITVPSLQGELMTFERNGTETRLEGHIRLVDDSFELRSKIFEGETRVAFERVVCGWEERDGRAKMDCTAPSGVKVPTEYEVERTETGLTLVITGDQSGKVQYAPRRIEASKL